MKIIAALLAGFMTVLFALPAQAVDVDSGNTVTKYGTEFTYNGGSSWTVKNTDNSKELKNIGPSQSVLCSNNHAGGAPSCEDGKSYTFTSNATDNGQNCAYIQGDGGNSGSWDTVPGDGGKRVCGNTTVEPPTEPPFNSYEKVVCWTVDSNTETDIWPQTLFNVGPCPEKSPVCEDTVFQQDSWTIDSKVKEDKANGLIDGKVLNGGDDSDLGPDPYRLFTALGDKDKCEPEPPVDVEIPVPAIPAVDDPCGVGNANWIIPEDTVEVDWTLVTGPLGEKNLSVHTKTGYVFADKTKDHGFGNAVETNVAECPVTPPTEPPVTPEPPVVPPVKPPVTPVPPKVTPEPPGEIDTPIYKFVPREKETPSETVVSEVRTLPATGAPQVLGIGILGLALLAGGTYLVVKKR